MPSCLPVCLSWPHALPLRLSLPPQATITTICCNPATLFLLLAYLPCPCLLSSSSCSLPVPDFQSPYLYPPLLLPCSHSVCFLVHRLLTTPNLLSYPPASAFLSTAITSHSHTTSILSSSTSLRHPFDLLSHLATLFTLSHPSRRRQVKSSHKFGLRPARQPESLADSDTDVDYSNNNNNLSPTDDLTSTRLPRRHQLDTANRLSSRLQHLFFVAYRSSCLGQRLVKVPLGRLRFSLNSAEQLSLKKDYIGDLHLRTQRSPEHHINNWLHWSTEPLVKHRRRMSSEG